MNRIYVNTLVDITLESRMQKAANSQQITRSEFCRRAFSYYLNHIEPLIESSNEQNNISIKKNCKCGNPIYALEMCKSCYKKSYLKKKLGYYDNLDEKIVIAIAEGYSTYRQLAGLLGINKAKIFYQIKTRFYNNDIIQWDDQKASTLRLGPNAAVVRHNGEIVRVMRAESIGKSEQ